jgi:hypothetical protein
VALGYGSYFAYLNTETARIDVPLLGDFHPMAFVAYFACFVTGAVFASIFFSVELARKSWQLRYHKKELGKAQKQPHKRVSRFLEEDAPAISLEEPVITRDDSKLY